jgi:hypothetical protein
LQPDRGSRHRCRSGQERAAAGIAALCGKAFSRVEIALGGEQEDERRGIVEVAAAQVLIRDESPARKRVERAQAADDERRKHQSRKSAEVSVT